MIQHIELILLRKLYIFNLDKLKWLGVDLSIYGRLSIYGQSKRAEMSLKQLIWWSAEILSHYLIGAHGHGTVLQ